MTRAENFRHILLIPVPTGSHPKPSKDGASTTLTKDAITRSVFDRVGLTRAASVKAVESTFEIIKKTLGSGEDVLITGFGKFCVKDKGKRRGRNPQTGKLLMLVERRIVTFKCSTAMKRNLNDGQEKPPAGPR